MNKAGGFFLHQPKGGAQRVHAVPGRTQVLIPWVFKGNTREPFTRTGDDVRRGGGIDHYQSEEEPSHVHSQPAKTSSLTSWEIRLYFTITRNVQMREGSLLARGAFFFSFIFVFAMTLLHSFAFHVKEPVDSINADKNRWVKNINSTNALRNDGGWRGTK